MKTELFIFLASLLIFAQAYEYKSNCACPDFDGVFPDGSSSTSQQSTGFLLSDNDEVINGVNYGRLISFAGNIWLGVDVQAYGSCTAIRNNCPPGYRLPTGNELRNLINLVNTSYSANQTDFYLNKFGLNGSNTYITSEKKWPNNTNGGDAEAYKFLALNFKNKVTPNLDWPCTYFTGAPLKAKCVLDLQPNAKYDFILNQTNPVKTGLVTNLAYKKDNTVANIWKVDSEVVGNTRSIDWLPKSSGCHVIESFLKVFGGYAIRQCKILWSELPFGSSSNTLFNINDISGKTFTDTTVNLVNSMHFNPSTAPIAARADGGMYVLLAAKDTLSLFVRVLDNNGNELNKIQLNRNGYPFDIIATPWGFVSMIRDKVDSNFMYLMGNYEDGTVRFTRTIMNNGPSPTNCTDQVRFYDSQGNQLFGMKAMYSPHNGRMAFLNGRINIMFAHYNHFGLLDNGNRNDHTGDTVLNFDENGQDERLVYSWGASHTLIQSIATSESMVFGAELSDAYPNGIRFVKFGVDFNPNDVDPITKLKNRIIYQSTEFISGKIPGNGGGASCGTLGSLIYLGNDQLAATYQRKNCNTSWSTNNKNEVGIVFFTANFTKINEVVLANGYMVNIVKTAKYGANILIAMGNSSIRYDYFPTRHCVPTADVMKLMLVSPQGTILIQETIVTPYTLTANDDFEVLSDGSVVWGFVNSANNFVLYKLPINPTTVLLENKNKLRVKKHKRSHVLIDKLV